MISVQWGHALTLGIAIFLFLLLLPDAGGTLLLTDDLACSRKFQGLLLLYLPNLKPASLFILTMFSLNSLKWSSYPVTYSFIQIWLALPLAHGFPNPSWHVVRDL